MKPIMLADKPESVVIEYNEHGLPKTIDYYFFSDTASFGYNGDFVELSMERYTPKYIWDFEHMSESFLMGKAARLPFETCGTTWLDAGEDYVINVEYSDGHQLFCDTKEEAWRYIGLASMIAAENLKRQKKPTRSLSPLVCRIKEARKEKEITQELLSKKSGVSRRNLSDIENGRRIPSLEVAMDIAEALGEPLSCLFERE